MRPHLDTTPCNMQVKNHVIYTRVLVNLEDGEARQTRHELDELCLATRCSHAEGSLHYPGPGQAPDPVLDVVIKLGAPPLEAGLAWASVGEFSASLTAGRRLHGGMIRGHSVARGQVPGDNNHNPLLEMVQNIPNLLALCRGQMLINSQTFK